MSRIALLVVSLFLVSCASTVKMTPTDRVPAAEAKMKLDTDDNSNTTIDLKIKHLAPPDKLRGDLTMYVLWTRTAASDAWTNIGQLKVGEDRTGEGTFSVPYQQFDVQVTAEASGQASTPSEFVVFEGQVDES